MFKEHVAVTCISVDRSVLATSQTSHKMCHYLHTHLVMFDGLVVRSTYHTHLVMFDGLVVRST